MKDAQKKSRPSSAAALVGRLAGATCALPAATGVFLSAALAGVPAATAVLRSVLAGVGVWIVCGIAVRLLFTFVIRDWRRAHAEAQARRRAAIESEGETA